MGRPRWLLWKTEPMLAKVCRSPFSHDDWLFEVKWDGIRCLLHLEGGEVRLQARSLRELTRTYPELLEPEAFKARQAVVDGEIVALDREGKASFNLLQNRMNIHSERNVRSAMERIPVTYYAFDLLCRDGVDLMRTPLRERKKALRQTIVESDAIKYSDHVERDGEEFYAAARDMGIEGVMAKRKDSLYEPGVRSSGWLKMRVTLREEFVIGGWSPGKGGRSRSLGALLLGQYDDGGLHYVGRVGTGFDSGMLRRLREMLDPREVKGRPFLEDPGIPAARWTRPDIVCDVKYSGRTRDALRFPVFMGLRPDKLPGDVRLPNEEPEPVRLRKYKRVKLSNPDKIFWPELQYTKADLLTYYVKVAEHILPHLRGRPLTLNRQPDGIHGESFYQRNRPGYTPTWVRSKRMARPGHTPIEAILCQDAEALAWLVNLGCIELHPWLSRVDDPEHPDLIIFDLDPVPPARYGSACGIALALRDALHEIGFRTYVKTSGKRGIHVYLPIERELDYEQARSFAAEVGKHLVPKFPSTFTMSRRAEDKAGRVFFDPGQMGWSRSLASPYSLRPTPRATVSTPITWDECESCIHPESFDINTVPGRLKERGDPWARMVKDAQPARRVLGLEGGEA